MKRSIFQSIIISSLIIISVNLLAADSSGGDNVQRWPKEISSSEGELTVYQPQLESLKKNIATARSAVSVKLSGENELIFGAVWLTSRLSTDRKTRMATLADIKVKRIKFSDDYKDKSERLTSLVKQGFLNTDIEISLDRLNTMLEFARKEEGVSKDFIMKPPEIIITTNPAFLVSIDGEPKLQLITGKKLMRVINSTYAIFLDTAEKKYYLGNGENWLSASDILGNWTSTTEVPDEVKDFSAGEKKDKEELKSNSGVLPEVIVTTNAAELIVINGDPEFVPIRGTDLLYIDNTEGDIFLETGSHKIYLLLSGRWYISKKEKGPWKYLASDKLPADFSQIPPGSPKGEILSQIAGTDEAQDAVLDSYIPQTATVNRDDTNLVVAFDGEPEFEDVEGTEMEYAINSQEQIIRVGGKYYCCKGGVWYVADQLLTSAEKVADVAGGVLKSPENINEAEAMLNFTFGTAWRICNIVPPVIYTIPPSCPVYPVTYCRVYGYDPEVVYVGYTPGYVGSYRYGGCMVYGTGYRYTPWFGNYYLPRPCTFGFSVRYNSRTGWALGIGYGGVYGGIGYRWGRGGWYGRGYGHRGYRRHHGGKVYVNNRNYKHEHNIYDNRKNRERNRNRGRGKERMPATHNRKRSEIRNRLPGTDDRKLSSSGSRELPKKRERTGSMQDLSATMHDRKRPGINNRLPETGDRWLSSTGRRELPKKRERTGSLQDLSATIHDRKRPRTDNRLPSTGNIPLPSTGNRPLPSTGNIPLPSTGNRPLPSTGNIPLPSTGNRPLPSTGNIPLPSTGNRPLPSTGNIPLPSTGNRPLPSTGNIPLPSTGNRPLPSTGNIPLPSTGNRPLPSSGNRELPGQGRTYGSLQDISTKESARARQSSKRNNVYADRNGNISRKSLDGWQTKSKKGWSSSNHSSQTRRRMDNQHKARQRGAASTRNYQQNRNPTRISTSHTSSRSSMSRPSTNHSRSRSSRPSRRSHGGRSRGSRR